MRLSISKTVACCGVLERGQMCPHKAERVEQRKKSCLTPFISYKGSPPICEGRGTYSPTSYNHCAEMCCRLRPRAIVLCHRVLVWCPPEAVDTLLELESPDSCSSVTLKRPCQQRTKVQGPLHRLSLLVSSGRGQERPPR